MRPKWLALVALGVEMVAPFAVVARTQTTGSGQPKPSAAAASPAKVSQQVHGDDGQRLFRAHCSRCHESPDGFSPSISNTIVRHMRVRANLSAHDETELRKFFNP